MKDYTAVSFRGNAQDIHKLKMLAAGKGTTVGELVANAIQIVYGDELRKTADFFDTMNDRQNHRAEKRIVELETT